MYSFNGLINAIDKVIKKADDDLSKKLEKEGFIKPDETVEHINALENSISDVLESQKEYILDGLAGATLDDDVAVALQQIFDVDPTDIELAKVFQEQFNTFMKEFTDHYIKDFDSELAFSIFTDRTTAWIDEWSSELGKLMKLSSHENINRILNTGLENGDSMQDILTSLMDNYGFSRKRASATAMTEILTAHSYAKEEAIRQSPVVEQKEWRHTGGHKNNPRPHHQALNGTIISKHDKFLIVAPTGTYEAMFPRDIALPAAERVNCHCVHRGIVNEDIMGLTLNERKKLQQQAIEEDNNTWEIELDEKNKAKAGIEI